MAADSSDDSNARAGSNKSADTLPAPKQIRFVNNQGQPPSKRRRISAACLTCRRRKTRCAGERPLCSTCTKNGHECLGYPEDKRDGDDATTKNAQNGDHETDPEDEDEHRTTDDQKASHSGAPGSSAPPVVNKRADEPLATIPEGKPPEPQATITPSNARASVSESDPHSPNLRRGSHGNRVPYFRYFGPTAIVPGFKQMVVSVRDRHLSGSHSGASPLSTPSGLHRGSTAGSDVFMEDLPVYDINDPAPVHPLIISLVSTFFTNLGCNYPFLRQRKFMRMVKDKTVEPILVDAVCAIAARFSDIHTLTGGNEKMPRTDRGSVFAQRARQATVDTFPAPSVGAVQACLLMAYEGFGANQDSALWMYLGIAIRMAVDLGLQKRVGIRYRGDKDPWYTRQITRTNGEDSPELRKSDLDALTLQEQKEIEEERLDTFWAVFFLDRVISSGTGRPVTFREDDLELSYPQAHTDAVNQWPSPFSALVEIIHLYGRVSDVLNNIHDVHDLTQEKWDRLRKLEHQLTRVYKNWDPRLQFNVNNFKAYLGQGQGTTFILLHFWFHALFIILHQPTLMTPFGDLRSELQLLSDSRELSMSSAKTICDILAFADLIEPNSFVGNPFTSQPIYIAACAFLMESSVKASAASSREGSQPRVIAPGVSEEEVRKGGEASKHSRHSLLASAANQNYQRCYSSLQHLHTYWGGIKYILTALDQKSKGIWDVETFTSEEYEGTEAAHTRDLSGQFPFESHATSPKSTGPPIAWSLAGTANSPSSSLTLMYQNLPGGAQAGTEGPVPTAQYDPIRSQQSLHDGGGMPPPAIPQPVVSAVRRDPIARHSNPPQPIAFDRNEGGVPEDGAGGVNSAANSYLPSNYTPSNQTAVGFDAFNASPASGTLGDGSGGHHLAGGVYGQAGYTQPWSVPGMDAITFDSQDIDIGSLGLQGQELMGGWLDYMPGDVLGLYGEEDMSHQGQ
ncbi:fungal specific transcription factor domain-containing protein [Sarocladium implicatum]|nr:fungal specific transcription factor domain-containing protein [Sarocladium implicatum]